MVELFSSLKGVIDFAWQVLLLPIPLARDFSVTLWELLLFILLGSILWRLINGLFLDTE